MSEECIRQHTHSLNENCRIGITFFNGERSWDEINTQALIALDRARVLAAVIPVEKVDRQALLREHGLTDEHISNLIFMLREQLEIMDICRREPCARGKRKNDKPKTHRSRKAIKEVTELDELWQKPGGDEPEA